MASNRHVTTYAQVYEVNILSVNMTSQSIAVGDNWVKVGNDYVGSSPNGATIGGNAALGWSAPSGLAQGGPISLSTDGTNPFGTGPTNVKFDSFANGADGVEVSTLNSVFDSTDANRPAKFTTDSRTGGLAITGWDDLDRRQCVNTINLTSTREVFVSYATKIPLGKFFPGTTSNNIPSDFYSSDSSWKVGWLQGPDSATNDICLPTHIGGGNWSISGNGLSVQLNSTELGGNKPSWFGFNDWTRLGFFLKAGAVPEVDLGQIYFQATTQGQSMFQVSKDVITFAGGGATAPYHWTKYNMTGYARTNGVDVMMLYDDFYIAWGDNAAARVELGNNAVYSSCTDLQIQHVTPANWATGLLEWNLDYGPFTQGDSLWLHITREDNTTRYSIQVG